MKDNILIRAIITGLGLRLGSELGKFIAARVFPKDEKKAGDGEDDDDDEIGNVSADPPEV